MEVANDGLEKNLWANMPEELLREVLTRIESSETTWPQRKSVVACGGVCRSWRRIINDIVKPLELSAIITFPISLKQAGPRENPLQCFIRRDRGTQTFYLFLNLTSALADDGKFLLAARRHRRAAYTEYIISLDPADISKGSNTYVGKLRSNFLATKFTIYDGRLPNVGAKISRSRFNKPVTQKQVTPRAPTGNYIVGHITYEVNMLGSRGPRRMTCVMDAVPAYGGVETELPSFPFFEATSTQVENSLSRNLDDKKDEALVLRNKVPVWHEQLQCWCLNFQGQGRVTVASVKNFQLVALPENGPQQEDKLILQFGKVGKDLFTMDFRYPMSAFQAFAISLSSFDTKIACE